MHGDTLTTAVFFAGSGIALVIAGVTQAGWKHRAVIWALLGVGVVFCGIGFLWPALSGLSPAFTGLTTSVATTPSSWFTALMFIAAVALFSPPKRVPKAHDRSLPPISTPELRSDLEKEIQALEKAVSAKIAALSGMVSKLQHDTAIELPNASTVVEAMRNLDDAVKDKVDRISEQIQGYSDRLRSDHQDLLGLLDFAKGKAWEMKFDYLISVAPQFSADDQDDLNGEVYKRNGEFLRDVWSTNHGISHDIEFRSAMNSAEVAVDGRLRAMPLEEWPSNANPVEVRSYLIAATQARYALSFLKRRREELHESLRNSAGNYQERYSQRRQAK